MMAMADLFATTAVMRRTCLIIFFLDMLVKSFVKGKITSDHLQASWRRGDQVDSNATSRIRDKTQMGETALRQ